MPLYVYQIIEADGSEGEIVELMQRMSDAPLTVHPESGKPMRKLLAVPNAVTQYGGDSMSNDRLGKLGFTKYEKTGDGTYAKTAGSGPDTISGN
jgi:predicted nucleic acid-binding Zn ribbon protein